MTRLLIVCYFIHYMESSKITQTSFIKKLRNKQLSLFTSLDVKKLFAIKNENTLKHLLRRLKRAGIVQRLIKDKYLFLQSINDPGDFDIANFLVTPSYISLESALSYYGIIDQFPYHISSITINKPRNFNVNEKTFTYSKINKGLFQDFVKIDNFLIASKEKALFDYCYFIYKGLRPLNALEDINKHLKTKSITKYFILKAKGDFKNFLVNHA